MTSLISKKSSPLSGITKISGDKSISHRALMLGALTVGETIISGLLESEDVLNTANAMRAMGAQIKHHSDGLWRCYGVGVGGLVQPENVLEMGNSGTSTRLLMGLVSTHPIITKFQGDASLTKRPMNRIIEPLEMMCANFDASEGGCLPITVHGTDHPLSIKYELPVASAQVKSAILLAGLNSKGRTTIIERKPTRDHTENMLNAFGVEVITTKLDNGHYAINMLGQQELQPCAIDVPGDPSSAAFPTVAAILTKGSKLQLSDIGINDRRIGLYLTLKEMGANITFEYEHIQSGEKIANIIVKGNSELKGINVDPALVPSMIDEFPILAIAAACARGTTTMTGLAELRVKESDRLLMMANGLKACGVNLEMGKDSLTIHGTGKPPKGGAEIKTAMDHRIAMSFLILGSVSDEPISIDDATSIQTSFPNFVKLMNELGCNINPINN